MSIMRSSTMPRRVPLIVTAFSVLLATSGARAGDAGAGKSVFQSSCSICHSVQPGQNKIGPALFALVGRKTGSVPGYSYSPANEAANLMWDEGTLDKYLESPRTIVPGTKMTYAGVKDPARRSDLIAYLATLK
jgi:cytochrome c